MPDPSTPAAIAPKNPNGPGKTAFYIFAGIAGWHVLAFLISFAHLGLPWTVIQGLESVVRFVGWIFFAVWIYRATATLQASGEKTKYSPGMAVGCWFIPFANFVMPFLALRDVCRRTLAKENLWLVPAWWISYWLTTVVTAGQAVWWRVLPHQIMPYWGYFSFAVVLAAYGSWAAILFLNTKESQAGAAVPA